MPAVGIVRLSISFGSDRSLWIAFSTEPALRMAVHRPALIAGRVNRGRRFNLTIVSRVEWVSLSMNSARGAT